MAQTPPSAGRPGRQLLVLGLVGFFLIGLMLFSGTSAMSWTERLEPRLGLDLVGGTRVTLLAVTEDGSNPTPDALDLARQIIESRVNALGVEEAEVVSEGDNRIVISVAGEPEDALSAVGQPAVLRFRKVIQTASGLGAPDPSELAPSPGATPIPGATPSPGATPDPAATPGPSPTATQEPAAVQELAAAQGPAAAQEPTATPEPEPTGTPTPSPGETGAPGDAADDRPTGDWGTVAERQRDVEEKISDEAMQAALALVEQGSTAQPTDQQLEDVRPFAELTGPEVEVLPAKLQFFLPTISCAQLNARPAGSIQDPEQMVVACDESGARKLLLDVAKVLGTDVDDANGIVPGGTTRWQVNLQFTGNGQPKWTDLTREATTGNSAATPFDPTALGMNVVAEGEGGRWRFDTSEEATAQNNRYQSQAAGGEPVPIQCDQRALGNEGNCLVATVLDNVNVSAPEIRSVITGDAQITGDFDADEAQLLASQLRFGSLPLTFEEQERQSLSATLGTSYLQAGLLAAAIGVGLVLLYIFFYYRLLGIVIFGSLIISSIMTYAALVVLGRGIGYTLTLAGITGFIVAVGIAADSFVIYFERLKDEIREGRTPRSAVPRAWARARRTIITANAVTLMAAVVLYLLSAGQVRGFAFALGLATVLDLLTVFTFRHPIMTLLARTEAFLSPQVSGLGRALALDRARAAGASAPRAREVEA